MSFDNDSKTRLKRWWYYITTLFSFCMEIRIIDLSFSIRTFFADINIETNFPPPYKYYWKSIFCIGTQLSENKSGEIQLTFRNDLMTGINIFKHMHSDHTPFNLEISVLGFTLILCTHDHRHWDRKNNKYYVASWDALYQEDIDTLLTASKKESEAFIKRHKL